MGGGRRPGCRCASCFCIPLVRAGSNGIRKFCSSFEAGEKGALISAAMLSTPFLRWYGRFPAASRRDKGCEADGKREGGAGS